MYRWLGVPLLCVGVLGVIGVVSAQDRRGSGPRVGYVDVKRALDEYTATATHQERLRKERGGYQDEITALQGKADRVRKELESLEPGSEKALALKAQLFHLDGAVKTTREAANYRIAADYAAATIQVYEELLKAVEDVAVERGLRTVEKIDPSPIVSDSLTEVNVRINGRIILYHDRSQDITDAVIARLNGK